VGKQKTEDDGFKLVGNRGKKREQQSLGKAVAVAAALAQCDCGVERARSVENRLCRAIAAVRSSALWSRAQRLLPARPCCGAVCYGLGAFCCSRVSLLQLAFFLLARDASHCPPHSTAIFDPLLGPACKAVCRAHGVAVLTVDERGLRRVPAAATTTAAAAAAATSATSTSCCSTKPWALFFMPHCDRFLYENVLRANWSPDALSRVVIIGNSFSRYTEREFGKASAASLLTRVAPYTVEMPLVVALGGSKGAGRSARDEDGDDDDGGEIAAALNDTSVHTFKKEQLAILWLSTQATLLDTPQDKTSKTQENKWDFV